MFGSLLIAGEWYVTALAAILVSCIDRFVYWLAAIAFDIFRVVSRINIFGGEGKGMDIYNAFTQRIYMILAIVMVFFFAYQMLTMIVNPDGEGAKKSSSMVKDIIISVVAITILPLVFRYMTIFQNHVVDDGTMFNIVLGTEGFDEVENPGRHLTMIVFTSFYHPYDTDINMFMDVLKKGEDADIEGIVNKCADTVRAADEYSPEGFWDGFNEWNPLTDDMAKKVCDGYVTGLLAWRENKNSNPILIASNSTLYSAINEAMEYYWIICTAAGVMLIWFFVSYAFNLGTRAVKLAFLELIAPVPLILRIMPNTRKSFDTWRKELIKTYCDIFIRLAVIAFIVQLCIMVPDIIGALFDSIGAIQGQNILENFVLRMIATVALLFGLLQFAKEAPELFKAIFSTGSGFFDGLDLKPGVKKRIEGNDYLMKGMSGASNAVGRVRGTMAQYNKDEKGKLHTLGGVMRNLPRDLKRGFQNGMGENSAKSLKDMRSQHISGITEGAQSAYKTQQNGLWHNVVDEDGKIRTRVDHETGTGHSGIKDVAGAIVHGIGDAYHETDAYAVKQAARKEILAAQGSGGRNVLAQQAAEVSSAFKKANEVYNGETDKVKDAATAHRDQFRSRQVQAQAEFDKFKRDFYDANPTASDDNFKQAALLAHMSPKADYTFTLNGVEHKVSSEKEFNDAANLEQRLKRAELIAGDHSNDIFVQGIKDMMVEADKMGALDSGTQKAINDAITKEFVDREAFNNAIDSLLTATWDKDVKKRYVEHPDDAAAKAAYDAMIEPWDKVQSVMKGISDATDTATRRSALQTQENK